MMSQVCVLARQAITSWGGFSKRPTLEDVVYAIENLGGSNKQSSGVISVYSPNYYQTLLQSLVQFTIYNLIQAKTIFSNTFFWLSALSAFGNTT